LTDLVYFNDVPVGTICCRLEAKDGQTKLYLMTMGVLAVSTIMSAEMFEINANVLLEALPGSTVRLPNARANFRGCVFSQKAENQSHIPACANFEW
jgi:hypothetical protein